MKNVSHAVLLSLISLTTTYQAMGSDSIPSDLDPELEEALKKVQT